MRYEITVRGHVGEATRASFDEFEVTVDDGLSLLNGDIEDQAALHAVLERLQRLGLVLEELHAIRAPEA